MASDFNPYHKWLGIPPGDQPPHHYRLLGVDPFESDLQVIESAADRQMTFVRTFQSGPNSDLSQRILNELAAAKITLLRPEKKAAYDQVLRAKLAARHSPAAAAADGGDLNAAGPAHAAPAQVASVSQPAPQPYSAPTQQPIAAWADERPVARPRSWKPAKKSSQLPLILSGIGVLLIAVVLGIVVLNRSDGSKDVAEAKSTPVASVAKPAEVAPAVSQAKPKKAKRPRNNQEPLETADAPRNGLPDESSQPPPRPAPGPEPGAGAATVAAAGPLNAKPQIPVKSAPIQAAIGEPIDLLKRIDLNRDTAQGPWHLEGDVLVSPMTGIGAWNPGANGGPRIRISPVPLSPKYRLNLDVRNWTSGGSLVIGLPVGDETRIAVIDGKNPMSNDNNHRFVFPGRGPNEMILSNAVYQFPTAATAHISILVTPQLWRFEIDDKTYFQFACQRGGAWNSWSVRDQPAIFVGCYGGGFRFSKLELINLDELPPPAPQANSVATNIPAPQSAPPRGNLAPLAPPMVMRGAPPSAESRAEAVARIREIYRDEYQNVGAAARTALASKMAKQADDGGNSPADRFVLLEEAATLAAAGNDMPLAANLLTTLGKRFAVDEQSMKLKLAAQTIKQAVTNQQRWALLTQLQTLAESEAQDQHYAQATDWFELALDLAKTAKNPKLTKQLKQSAADLKELVKRNEEAGAAKKQLAAQPDSAEAHAVLGKFLCFTRDDWREGLAHLAQGDDKPLSEAANRDLQTSTDTADQLAVGDAWFLLGQKSAYSESDRNAMHQRASSWYTKALPQLSAKDKARVQGRLTKYPLVAKSANVAAVSRGPDIASATAPNPVAAVVDPDMQRRLAVWAIQAGQFSNVVVSAGNGSRSYYKVEELPEGPFDIVSVYLLNVRQQFGQEFSQLASLPNLRSLHVLSYGRTLSDDETRTIGQLRKLTSLQLDSHFASPELACGEIAKLTELNSLTLNRSNLSDAVATALPNMTKLTILQLNTCGVSDASLSVIGRLSGLITLQLKSNPITDSGLVHLQGLSNLDSLSLDGTKVTDAGMKDLAKLTSISLLGLGDTKVSGEGVRQLAPLTRLKRLWLDRTAISDQGIHSLNALVQLDYLNITQTAISDEGLKQLKDLTQLKNLYALSTQVTPDGAQAFMDLHPNCKVIIR